MDERHNPTATDLCIRRDNPPNRIENRHREARAHRGDGQRRNHAAVDPPAAVLFDRFFPCGGLAVSVGPQQPGLVRRPREIFWQ